MKSWRKDKRNREARGGVKQPGLSKFLGNKPKPSPSKRAIQEAIANTKEGAVNALLFVYNRQTVDEQEDGFTKHDNAVGFNGTDARILSSIANHYIEKGFISDKQLVIVQKKMPKYWAQIMEGIEADAFKEGVA